MPDLDDGYLEALLREHLTAELNGQLGRPMAAFFAHAAPAVRAGMHQEEGDPPVTPLVTPLQAPTEKVGRSKGLNRFNRFDGWFLPLAGTALAASLAALWAAPAAFRGHAPALPVRAIQPAPRRSFPEMARNNAEGPEGAATNDLASMSSRSPLMQWVQSRTVDEGTVVLDDPDHAVPARKLRHQELEHTQWYDPSRRAQVEMTVPREKIKFVEMDTY